MFWFFDFFGFLFFILIIVSLAMNMRLRARVEKLEKRYLSLVSNAMPSPSSALERTPQDAEPYGQVGNEVDPASLDATRRAELVAEYKAEEGAPDRFIEWLKEDWLLKLGALLLLIGFGWLVSYAFLNNWIGPQGRIGLGLLAGTLLLAFGWWRMRSFLVQGGVFMVVGSTTILLTVYAARSLYDFFTPLSALVVMFLSSAFVALASVQYNRRPLALASLILAGIAPLLTASPIADYVGLFMYLLVVVAGAIWVTTVTGQRSLTAAALIMVAVYGVPFLSGLDYSADQGVVLLFMYAFSALFFLTNTAGILYARGKDIVVDTVTAAGNGLHLLLWVLIAAPDVWQSLILAAWTVVFVSAAFLLFKATGDSRPLYVYAGVGIAMLGAATAAELDGAALTVAFALEACAVCLVSYFVLSDTRIMQRAALLFAIPGLLSFESIASSSWNTSVFHADFFVLAVMSVVLFLVAYISLMSAEYSRYEDVRSGAATLVIFGSAYAFVLLWLSLHAALVNNDTAVMIALAVYTIIGIAAYFWGLSAGASGVRLYGGILLALVVARLLLVDVWNMELSGRIITFFLIGALLMGTAFLSRKRSETASSPPSSPIPPPSSPIPPPASPPSSTILP